MLSKARYLKYLGISAGIVVPFYFFFFLVSSPKHATSIAVISFPLALWSARLMVAYKSGVITRRLPMLDGGPAREGDFLSFTPDIYVREPGFDYFKGYFIKEFLACFLVWVLIMAPAFMKLFDG